MELSCGEGGEAYWDCPNLMGNVGDCAKMDGGPLTKIANVLSQKKTVSLAGFDYVVFVLLASM